MRHLLPAKRLIRRSASSRKKTDHPCGEARPHLALPFLYPDGWVPCQAQIAVARMQQAAGVERDCRGG